jgi:hypothetical protein
MPACACATACVCACASLRVFIEDRFHFACGIRLKLARHFTHIKVFVCVCACACAYACASACACACVCVLASWPAQEWVEKEYNDPQVVMEKLTALSQLIKEVSLEEAQEWVQQLVSCRADILKPGRFTTSIVPFPSLVQRIVVARIASQWGMGGGSNACKRRICHAHPVFTIRRNQMS